MNSMAQQVAVGPERPSSVAYGLSTLPSAIDPCAASLRKPQIFFLDEDVAYKAELAIELGKRDLALRHFADSKSFLAAIDETATVDLIVLDWHAPERGGLYLLNALRRRGIKLPVVFLTVANRPIDEIRALDQGAADFVDKSRGAETLVRRLKTILFVHGSSPSQETGGNTACGKLTLHRGFSRASWGGTDLNLTLSEYRAVEVLALNAGSHVPYRTIYDRIRRPGFIAGRDAKGYQTNVRTTVKRARKKFVALDPSFDLIETYIGFGYRWRRTALDNTTTMDRGSGLATSNSHGQPSQDVCPNGSPFPDPL